MTVAGDCPRCGTAVDPGRARAATAAPPTPPTPPTAVPLSSELASSSSTTAEGDAVADADWIPDLEPVPWHLKLLASAVALYLGWRAFQGIEWLIHRF